MPTCWSLGESRLFFGANFFASRLPDGKAWIVWDKDASGMFSACELAWTSWSGRLRMYRHMWSGLRREGPRKEELAERVHPTQKPVGLFTQILTDYSKEAQTVLNPYIGSGTTVIACEQLQRHARAIEIEPEYVQSRPRPLGSVFRPARREGGRGRPCVTAGRAARITGTTSWWHWSARVCSGSGSAAMANTRPQPTALKGTARQSRQAAPESC